MRSSLEQQLIYAHDDLHDYGLVQWTMGNISARDTDGILIKPSGLTYSQLDQMVRVGLDGSYDQGQLKPSTDLATHLFIYNELPHINCVVHTHSQYATAFAAQGMPIPCILTEIADEFGGDIPVSDECAIGDEEIGREVVRLTSMSKSTAVLIKSHGVFCIGKSIHQAVKAAVMCEHAAQVCHLARNLGGWPVRLASDVIAINHQRYHNTYGQVAASR